MNYSRLEQLDRDKQCTFHVSLSVRLSTLFRNSIFTKQNIMADHEVTKWRERFPQYEFRLQDDCIALKMDHGKAQTETETERLREALEKIDAWAKAYPLDVFPEPDLKRAHEVLKEAGMGLDAISASNMRHVLNGVAAIVRDALGPTKP